MLGLVAPLLLFWTQPGRRVDLSTAPAALRGVRFRTSDAVPNPPGASVPKAEAEQRVNKTFALAAVLDMSRSGANADYDARRVHECSGPLQANDLWTSSCHQRLSSSLKDGVTAVDGQVRRRRPGAFAPARRAACIGPWPTPELPRPLRTQRSCQEVEGRWDCLSVTTVASVAAFDAAGAHSPVPPARRRNVDVYLTRPNTMLQAQTRTA